MRNLVESSINALSRFSVRNPFWVLLGILFIMVPLGYQVGKHIEDQDNSSRIWFPRHDLSYAYYDVFKDEFESDENVVVAIKARNGIFNRETLEIIRAVEAELEKIQNIEDVKSILSMNNVRGEKILDEDGQEQFELRIEPLFPEDAEFTPEEIAFARERAMADENMVGNLISPDGNFAAVFGRIVATDDMGIKRKLTEDSKAALRRLEEQFKDMGVVFSENTNALIDFREDEFKNAPIQFYLAGIPIFDYEFDALSVADQQEMTPLTLAVIIVVLLLMFRSIPMAFIPMGLMMAVVSIVWGLYVIAGQKMNMLVGMTAPVLIVACVGDSVHILSAYFLQRRPGVSRMDAILEAARQVNWPCLFTSITTFFGFVTFSFAYVPPMRWFGLCAAFGALVAYILTFSLVPAIISALDRIEQWTRSHETSLLARILGGPVRLFLREPKPEQLETLRSGMLSRFLEGMANATIRFRAAIIVVLVAVTGVSVWGASKIKIESNNLDFIPDTHYVQYAMTAVQDELTGLSNIEVIFEGDENFAKNPDVLKRVDSLVETVKARPHVSTVFSHTVYLKQIHRAMHGGDESYFKVPDSEELIAQYLLLAELSGDKDIKSFVNYDYSRIRVTIRSSQTQSSEFKLMVKEITADISQLLPDIRRVDFTQLQPGFRSGDPFAFVSSVRKSGDAPVYKITGLIPLYSILDRNFLETLLKSFSQSFALVLLCLIFMTRSLKRSLMGMVPTVFPLAVTGGMMGFVGWKLDPATILIAGMVLGLAVDNAIHYLARFETAIGESGNDYRNAIHYTAQHVGRALFAAGFILVFGFGVMMFGSFYPTRNFGMLSAMNMFLAIGATMLFLPVLFQILRPYGKPSDASSVTGAEPAGEPPSKAA
ncbi:MAG: MMPL family transporter [Deltaproteobacteria bacterium]|nr:MMPL family transporter [Deltaproteobacteria bacterium]